MNNAAVESLYSFAFAHHFYAFAHLCTEALNGEEWAVERVAEALLALENFQLAGRNSEESKLVVIHATDTSRPDGAIARSFQI